MPVQMASARHPTMRIGSLKTLPRIIFMPTWIRPQSCWNRLMMSLAPMWAKSERGLRRTFS